MLTKTLIKTHFPFNCLESFNLAAFRSRLPTWGYVTRSEFGYGDSKHVIGSRYHGIATGVSHAFGIGVYALLSVTGLVILIQEAPIIFRVLTWVGAIYLLWLGWQGVTAKKGLIAQNESQISTLQISSAARDGLAISLLNPKISAFFVALFSQFVDQATNLLNSSIMVATPMLIDGLWYSLIAIFVSQKFLLKQLRKYGVWVDRAIGILLILIALRVFFNDPLI